MQQNLEPSGTVREDLQLLTNPPGPHIYFLCRGHIKIKLQHLYCAQVGEDEEGPV